VSSKVTPNSSKYLPAASSTKDFSNVINPLLFFIKANSASFIPTSACPTICF